MPSKSAQQHSFMEAAAHNPAFAEKAGISQDVAREFVAADKKKARKRKPSAPRKSRRKTS
jgi:hypothetical protein